MEFDLITFIAQIFNFLILLWVLKKFLYAPLLNAMKERKENIIKSLEDAEVKKEEAEKIRLENEQLFENSRKNKNALLVKAEKEVRKEKEKMLKELKDEQEIAMSEFVEQMQVKKQRFIKEVNKVVANKFVGFAQKVFLDLSNTEIEAQVIEVFLTKIKDLTKFEIDKINTSAKIRNGEIIIATSNDLSKEVADKIRDAIKKIGVKYNTIKFEKDSEIILGVNLKAGGYVISWDLKEFLNSFKEELTKILK